MAKKADLLDQLHKLLCETMLDRIKNPEVTAADMSVIRQFLKDNHIDATTKARPELEELAQKTLEGLPTFEDNQYTN